MSCYFRHMKDVFEQLGIEVTKANKKQLDKIMHGLVDVEYKNCSPTWKAVRDQIKGDDKARNWFIKKLKQQLEAL